MAFDNIAYKNEFNREKYDRISLIVPKGAKDDIKRAALACGVSVNQFITDALRIAYNLNVGQ